MKGLGKRANDDVITARRDQRQTIKTPKFV